MKSIAHRAIAEKVVAAFNVKNLALSTSLAILAATLVAFTPETAHAVVDNQSHPCVTSPNSTVVIQRVKDANADDADTDDFTCWTLKQDTASNTWHISWDKKILSADSSSLMTQLQVNVSTYELNSQNERVMDSLPLHLSGMGSSLYPGDDPLTQEIEAGYLVTTVLSPPGKNVVLTFSASGSRISGQEFCDPVVSFFSGCPVDRQRPAGSTVFGTPSFDFVVPQLDATAYSPLGVVSAEYSNTRPISFNFTKFIPRTSSDAPLIGGVRVPQYSLEGPEDLQGVMNATVTGSGRIWESSSTGRRCEQTDYNRCSGYISTGKQQQFSFLQNDLSAVPVGMKRYLYAQEINHAGLELERLSSAGAPTQNAEVNHKCDLGISPGTVLNFSGVVAPHRSCTFNVFAFDVPTSYTDAQLKSAIEADLANGAPQPLGNGTQVTSRYKHAFVVQFGQMPSKADVYADCAVAKVTGIQPTTIDIKWYKVTAQTYSPTSCVTTGLTPKTSQDYSLANYRDVTGNPLSGIMGSFCTTNNFNERGYCQNTPATTLGATLYGASNLPVTSRIYYANAWPLFGMKMFTTEQWKFNFHPGVVQMVGMDTTVQLLTPNNADASAGNLSPASWQERRRFSANVIKGPASASLTYSIVSGSQANVTCTIDPITGYFSATLALGQTQGTCDVKVALAANSLFSGSEDTATITVTQNMAAPLAQAPQPVDFTAQRTWTSGSGWGLNLNITRSDIPANNVRDDFVVQARYTYLNQGSGSPVRSDARTTEWFTCSPVAASSGTTTWSDTTWPTARTYSSLWAWSGSTNVNPTISGYVAADNNCSLLPDVQTEIRVKAVAAGISGDWSYDSFCLPEGNIYSTCDAESIGAVQLNKVVTNGSYSNNTTWFDAGFTPTPELRAWNDSAETMRPIYELRMQTPSTQTYVDGNGTRCYPKNSSISLSVSDISSRSAATSAARKSVNDTALSSLNTLSNFGSADQNYSQAFDLSLVSPDNATIGAMKFSGTTQPNGAGTNISCLIPDGVPQNFFVRTISDSSGTYRNGNASYDSSQVAFADSNVVSYSPKLKSEATELGSSQSYTEFYLYVTQSDIASAGSPVKTGIPLKSPSTARADYKIEVSEDGNTWTEIPQTSDWTKASLLNNNNIGPSAVFNNAAANYACPTSSSVTDHTACFFTALDADAVETALSKSFATNLDSVQLRVVRKNVLGHWSEPSQSVTFTPVSPIIQRIRSEDQSADQWRYSCGTTQVGYYSPLNGVYCDSQNYSRLGYEFTVILPAGIKPCINCNNSVNLLFAAGTPTNKYESFGGDNITGAGDEYSLDSQSYTASGNINSEKATSISTPVRCTTPSGFSFSISRLGQSGSNPSETQALKSPPAGTQCNFSVGAGFVRDNFVSSRPNNTNIQQLYVTAAQDTPFKARFSMYSGSVTKLSGEATENFLPLMAPASMKSITPTYISDQKCSARITWDQPANYSKGGFVEYYEAEFFKRSDLLVYQSAMSSWNSGGRIGTSPTFPSPVLTLETEHQIKNQFDHVPTQGIKIENVANTFPELTTYMVQIVPHGTYNLTASQKNSSQFVEMNISTASGCVTVLPETDVALEQNDLSSGAAKYVYADGQTVSTPMSVSQSGVLTAGDEITPLDKTKETSEFNMDIAGAEPGAAAVDPTLNTLIFQTGKLGETTGRGFMPGTVAEVWLFSARIFLGYATVGPDGTFVKQFTVPSNIELGAHTIQAEGITLQQENAAVAAGVRVTGSSVSGSGGSGSGSGFSSGSGGSGSSSGASTSSGVFGNLANTGATPYVAFVTGIATLAAGLISKILYRRRVLKAIASPYRRRNSDLG